jgi:hypothetical protein
MPQAFSFQLLTEKAWFNPSAIQVRFLGNKVPLETVFPSTITPSILHIHIHSFGNDVTVL